MWGTLKSAPIYLEGIFMTQKLQYAHCRPYNFIGELLCKGGETYCVEMLTTIDFKKNILENYNNIKDTPITLNVGVAKCHRQDPYNKKVGNALALSRLAPISFEVSAVSLSPNTDSMKVLLSNINLRINMELNILLSDDTRYSRLLKVDKF